MEDEKKKHLIIVHPHFTIPGGAGRVILELGKRLAGGYKVVVVAQQINKEYFKQYPEIVFENLNGPLTDSFFFWFGFLFWRAKTKKVINKYYGRYDLDVICNGFPANWVGLSLRHNFKEAKFFWFCHEPSAFIHVKRWRQAIKSPIKRFVANTAMPIFALIDKKLTKRADRIFANSNYTKANIKKVYGTTSIVVYPGVETDFFKPIEYGQKKNYLLAIGRLTKYKRIDLLIRAFSKIDRGDVDLYIVGDGEEKEMLEKLAASLGLGRRVRFLPPLQGKKLVQMFSRAKILISASRNETFGLVLGEAMAAGTPVIADNSGGAREIILNGKNGSLIDCSEANLTEAIDSLLSDKLRLKRYSSEARSWIVGQFNWERSVALMKKYL
jgi:glycosyltransferase involved in cell wall biosynthesis